MNRPVEVSELESALMERARTLADEYLSNARRTRDQIIADATERLRLREDREILAAKAAAERSYRQRLQASEIRRQAELDGVRWGLVQGVLDRVPQRLREITRDEPRYLGLLRQYLARAASAIERDEIVAAFNAGDRERLAPQWDSFARAVSEKRLRLASEPIACLGGVRVSSIDGDIRIDHTFEGRLERMQEELHRVVAERLFASAEYMGALFTG